MNSQQRPAERLNSSAPVDDVEMSVTFGSVTVKVIRPSATVIQCNIEAGQAALMRAKTALVKPGVTIARAKGKPLYFCSSERPDVIIREVDGVRTIGKFACGRFRPLKDVPSLPTVKAPKMPTIKSMKLT